jgi:hypothetical protein
MKASALPVIAALAVAACGSTRRVDTHVGHEELYRSGNFDYDDFFEDVNSLQLGSKNAEADERGARAPLGVALGLGETSVDRLLDALRARAQELSAGKARVHLSLEGLDEEGRPLAGQAPSVATSAAKRPVSKDATQLARALGQTAQGEAQVWEKYASLPEKGRRLAGRAKELEASLDRDFMGASRAKREQVERELAAATAVSNEIADTCDKVVVTATRFLKEGREILVASASAQAPQPAASPPRGGAKPSGKSKGARGSKPSPAPSAGAPDFNP